MSFNKELNVKLVLHVLGKLLIILGSLMMLNLIVSLIYKESDGVYFVYAGLITAALGFLLTRIGRKPSHSVGKREGNIIVTFIWLLFALLGALPYWLSGSIPSFTDAFFETMSGFTTTGASTLNDIESLSHGILFWRSFSHWVGGLGIIVLTLAILPMLGINGTQLFGEEVTGPTKEKMSPKVNDTAKILFVVYFLLTFMEVIFLLFGGMNLFDAICHSFGTIATGGFSTKQTSIGYYNSPYIEYVVTFFMLMAGVNFTLYFLAYRRQFEKIKVNEELKFYLLVVLTASIAVTLSMIDFKQSLSFAQIEAAWRHSIFTIASIMTTTGYATVDFFTWTPFAIVVVVLMMFIGGSAGSTAGGMKVVRIQLAIKSSYYQVKRILHPSAIIPLKSNRHIVSDSTVNNVFVFMMLYITILIFGIMVLLINGVPLAESAGSMITCLGCVGPGFGSVGPSGNFSHLPEFSKWFLAFMMLIGRLELYTVFAILTPACWKR